MIANDDGSTVADNSEKEGVEGLLGIEDIVRKRLRLLKLLERHVEE